LAAPIVEETSPFRRERLFRCDYFWLWRVRGESAFTVKAVGGPRVLVCIDGTGQLNYGGATYPGGATDPRGATHPGGATYEIGKGDVVLLPAALGECTFQPRGSVNVLEIEIPA
jgi:mannose-6-phosphate isomerase